jgi:NACHT domain-containing protein
MKKGEEMSQPNSQLHVQATPYFTGRVHELNQLKKWFRASRNTSKVVTLWGESGVGKSQLAMKFAQDNREEYNRIFFIDATSLEVLQTEFMKLQETLFIQGDSSNAIECVVNWLIQNAQRWLLILDGANRFQLVVSIISRLAYSGHILITTVDTSFRGHSLIHEHMNVGVLSVEDSMLLFFARARLLAPLDQIDIATVQRLLEELGRLPLAIDSSGAYINFVRKNVQEYAILFHDNKSQQDILNYGLQETPNKRFIMNALGLTFKEIDNRPDARTLLSLLVFLDRAEVTLDFLRRGTTKQKIWNLSGEPIEVDPDKAFISEELILLLNDEARLQNAVEDLVKLSILKIRPTDNGLAFEMHEIHQECARIRMPRDQRRKYSVQALFFLAQAFPSDEYVLDNGYVICECLLPFGLIFG